MASLARYVVHSLVLGGESVRGHHAHVHHSLLYGIHVVAAQVESESFLLYKPPTNNQCDLRPVVYPQATPHFEGSDLFIITPDPVPQRNYKVFTLAGLSLPSRSFRVTACPPSTE